MNSTEDAIRRQQIRDAGFDDYEIDFYGLIDKTEGEIFSYLSNYFCFTQFIDKLNGSQKEILKDKVAAQYFLNGSGINTPQLIGVWHPVFGMTGDGRSMTTIAQFSSELLNFLKDSDPLEVIFKPRAGDCGEGVVGGTFLKSATNDVVAMIAGEPYSVEKFFAGLPDISGDASQGWVVQVKVQQHPDMARLNPSSLNTVRALTFVPLLQDGSAEGTSVKLDHVRLRVGRSDSIIDNWSKGGLLIEIDRDSGTLKQGRFALEFGGGLVEEHPDSKLNFVGLEVPFWDEVVALCVKAAKAFPSVRAIGWDVAITKDGPMIIEGNPNWGTRTIQAFGKGYLTPEFRARFESEGIQMPAAMLPPKRKLPK
ncbi:hypothetical protein ROA7450_02641 [Roseovarius albus]|uniref:Alpha-L-glutamate ligase-related protein ATP-grasp domain-containing protein n=1 Tax=Roseovarius albus TaxID=1247867 RepID=A0A1X6ZIP8_9RHOB|nr:sugar-transfer associated ATP-grasp domain-containing protein [Roseovarius albus]SLN52514.1 hypothetical protein ROA7450_02641 [Roseovarius albus]